MLATIMAAGVRLICGCRPRWSVRIDFNEPLVYFANHSSHFDAVLIWAGLPPTVRRRTRMIAAKDYWEATPLRRWLSRKVFDAILIDRESPSRANNPIDQLCAALESGVSVIIFPEGGRTDDHELQTFRAGLWHLARRRPTQLFVPVWLENLSRVLPKGEFLPVPVLCGLTFGSPLTRPPNADRKAFLEMLHTELTALAETHA